ncbi:MAG: hydrogenase formation protein HypD [Nitrospinota bacterium]
MRYIEEFRQGAVAAKIVERLRAYTSHPVNLMEVCGTHTVSIFRHGIRDLLPRGVTMLSGPGCPVCVTANADLDKAIALAEIPGVILATFGDMLKVPASYSSLREVKAEGADVRLVYSTLDALEIARANPQRQVVFFAVGFETTAPTIACSILEAEREGIENFSIVSVHKLIPPAIKALLDGEEVRIDGFLLPGHVSTIIGSRPYEFVPSGYGVACAIAGFEPLDILGGIEMLLRQIADGEVRVEIGYRRAVRREGNPLALEQMYRVFEVCDAEWRGLGVIPDSGLRLRKEYERFDAERRFDVNTPPPREHPACRCGEVLRGVTSPPECPLFARACTPEHPIGPCMVSVEGSCAAWYRYGGL